MSGFFFKKKRVENERKIFSETLSTGLQFMPKEIKRVEFRKAHASAFSVDFRKTFQLIQCIFYFIMLLKNVSPWPGFNVAKRERSNFFVEAKKS